MFALGWIACSGFGPRAEVKVSEAERRDYANALSVLADDPAAAEQRLVAFVRGLAAEPAFG